MASGDDSTPPAASPPHAAAQPPPPLHPFSEWPGSTQAFFGGGAASSTSSQVFFPYPSPSLHWGRLGGDGAPPHPYMMYGTQVPYPPVYPSGGFYAHPSAAMVKTAAEAERMMAEASATMEGLMNSKPLEKAASGSLDEDASESDFGSEGSSYIREQSTDPQSKKNSSSTFGDGGITQHVTSIHQTNSSVESSPAPKPSVSPNLLTDLNVGMKSFSASLVSSKIRHSSMNNVLPMAATVVVGREGLVPSHPLALQDEHDVRKEKRKQSNRESARRSRLRKQQECVDINGRVDALNSENLALRSELVQLNQDCEDLEKENASIEAELVCLFGPGVLSALKTTSSDLSGDGEA